MTIVNWGGGIVTIAASGGGGTAVQLLLVGGTCGESFRSCNQAPLWRSLCEHLSRKRRG